MLPSPNTLPRVHKPESGTLSSFDTKIVYSIGNFSEENKYVISARFICSIIHRT